MAESKLALLKENLQTEQPSIFEPEIRKKKKAGRKPKVKGKRLSSRVTFLLSSSDDEALKLKRRAGELGEIDEPLSLENGLQEQECLTEGQSKIVLQKTFHQN